MIVGGVLVGETAQAQPAIHLSATIPDHDHMAVDHLTARRFRLITGIVKSLEIIIDGSSRLNRWTYDAPIPRHQI